MAEIYRLKDNITIDDFNDLSEYGYIVNQEDDQVIKIVVQDSDSEPVKFLLKNIYNNKEWIEKFYKRNKKYYKKNFDLKYDKNGSIIITEQMKDILETWYIRIDFDDGWIGFRSIDSSNKMTYYGKKVLDKYCPNEIFTLMSHDFIYVDNVDDE